MNVYTGEAVLNDGRFAVVVSRFNSSITPRLLNGAVKTLTSHGIPEDRIDVAWVPGAFRSPRWPRDWLRQGGTSPFSA